MMQILEHAVQIASSVALGIVCLAAVLHLATHVDASSPECERWGFTLTAAGAFGVVVYMWWPTIEDFPFELVMHLGMALIALSLVRGTLRAWIARARWDGTDRRTVGPAIEPMAARFERRE